jgi:hypothetical protein
VTYNRAHVGSTPTPTTINGQCVTALFLSQGATMKRMHIETVVRREIEETWQIEIQDDDDPQDIFEAIKQDPNSLWLKYDALLIDAYDLDETLPDVIRFEEH